MRQYKIPVVAGDGVGPEIIRESNWSLCLNNGLLLVRDLDFNIRHGIVFFIKSLSANKFPPFYKGGISGFEVFSM